MTRPHAPTQAQRAEVKALSSVGIPQDQIASYVGIDTKTLRKHYREELDKGMIQANASVAKALFKQATELNSTPAAIFWLKIRAGWQEKQAIDVTTKGESINKGIDPAKLTDEQLRNLDTILSQASETGTG